MESKRLQYLARLSAAAAAEFNDHAVRREMLSYVA
jgi:hypothetical protein